MPQKETITVKEASAIIGICEDTLYAMVRQKEIPHIRVRRRILFRYSSIMEWMAKQEQISIGA